jgi:hypothetical protein
MEEVLYQIDKVTRGILPRKKYIFLEIFLFAFLAQSTIISHSVMFSNHEKRRRKTRVTEAEEIEETAKKCLIFIP